MTSIISSLLANICPSIVSLRRSALKRSCTSATALPRDQPRSPCLFQGCNRFSRLICYESLFPGAFARSGPRPNWIANISNDAWFGETSGPWQHLNLASYRAIEEGVPVVRATPTGVSAVVDSYGRPLQLLKLGQAGVIDQLLPPPLRRTLYSRWRDLPFWVLCVLGMGAALIGRRGDAGRSRVRQRWPRRA